MPSTIHTLENRTFPKLGWFAQFEIERDRLEVVHGSAVEHGETFVVEGVWDGDFNAGDFHKSENFFGSGVRLDSGWVYFVPSSATVDRLFYCSYDHKVFVSNSVLILLANTGAKLDPARDYRMETSTVKEGLVSYRKDFPVQHPSIDCFYQVYGENIVLQDRRVRFERRDGRREIANFDEYRELLAATVASICNNYRNPTRQVHLSDYSTLSTGYDSPAVACLVKGAGVDQCFTFTGSWSEKSEGDARYDAGPIARALNLTPISLDLYRHDLLLHEPHLYASGPVGVQLPLLGMGAYIKRNCESAVVFTGYHGDVVWNVNSNKHYLDSNFRRHDISGLDLAELRLHCGFIHVPLPFVLASNAKSIVELSRHPDMESWRLFNNYDRPIPRRILEEEGVERMHFGMHKGALFTRYSRPVDRTLRNHYYSFLRRHYNIGILFFYFRLICDRISFKGLAVLTNLVKEHGRFATMHRKLRDKHRDIGEGGSFFPAGVNFRVSLFFWSVDFLTAKLKDGG